MKRGGTRQQPGARRAGRIGLTLLASLLCTIVAAPLATRTGAVTVPAARWSTCQNGKARCTTVDVPLDYAHPRSSTIPLAVVEEPATDPSDDVGALFFNPGGPGESGVEILPVIAALLPPDVRAHFDLVSFDERGTGASDPLNCGPAPAQAASADPVASRPGGELPAAGIYATLARECAHTDGGIASTMTTANSARDMDRIRQALGIQRLNYWGVSYGTVLGSLYAHLFPTHVRAMVLDGAVDAVLPLAQQATEEAPAINASLAHYFTTCAVQPECPLGTNPASTYGALVKAMTAHPLPAPGGGDDVAVTAGDLETATLFYLSVPEYASGFPAALSAALHGDGAPLRTLSLDFETDLDGASLVGPLWAITCDDSAHHLGGSAAGALARQLSRRYPLDGAYAVTYDLAGCVDWPRSANPLTSVANRGAPSLLIVSNSGDPNTPHRAGVQLAAAVGRARLLTWQGWGHSWILNGSKDLCMQAAITAYLEHGTLPPAGTSCA
jgi:pimeloyl-ACP methyl ester carboxylesterase